MNESFFQKVKEERKEKPGSPSDDLKGQNGLEQAENGFR